MKTEQMLEQYFPLTEHILLYKAGREVWFMDYKKEIIKMIDGIESQKILRYIYIIVADIYNDLRR